jgi:hypothetical protein
MVRARPVADHTAMRDGTSMREAVEKARRRHEDMADDRLRGEGQLGDEELFQLLLVSYPTLDGQRN